MYYYLILALQGFCIYHCYTNRNSYYWIFAIIFLPIVGSLIYLFMNVVRKRDVEKAQESLVHTLNPSKRISDLEKRLKFSETFENRIALADALMDDGLYDRAVVHYNAALKDMFKEDYYVLSKLTEAHYKLSHFGTSIGIAEKIRKNPNFPKSRANFLYGLALEKEGDLERSEKELKRFDAPYNYHAQRLELARFFMRTGKRQDAIEVYQELVNESESMSKQSFRTNKWIITSAREELSAIS